MTITSSPSGALVYMNDVEVGRTPITRDFTNYGTYEVAIRKDGYNTLNTSSVVIAPWWNWVPFDLVAATLPLTDRQRLHYDLTPAGREPMDNQKMVERARKLEAQLPATQPSK